MLTNRLKSNQSQLKRQTEPTFRAFSYPGSRIEFLVRANLLSEHEIAAEPIGRRRQRRGSSWLSSGFRQGAAAAATTTAWEAFQGFWRHRSFEKEEATAVE